MEWELRLKEWNNIGGKGTAESRGKGIMNWRGGGRAVEEKVKS